MNDETKPHTLADDVGPTPRPMTTGEERVRVSFNPSQDPNVETIKAKTAELIDLAENLGARDPRLASLAMTAFEQGCMWLVKLATTP